MPNQDRTREQLLEELAFLRACLKHFEQEEGRRRHAEAALRESSEFSRQIIASARDGIIVYNRELRYVLWNPYMEELTGVRAEELLGKFPWEVFPVLEAVGIIDLLKRALAGEVVPAFEWQVNVRRTGMKYWESSRSQPLRNARGEIIGVLTIVRDITESKTAEGLLRQSEERFRQMAAAIPEVFWMAAPDLSQTLYVSPAYETIWGRSCASACEGPSAWIDTIHPDDQPEVRAKLAQRTEAGRPDLEYRVVRPDGTVRWVHDRAFLIRDEAGIVYRAVGIATDITERKQAEEEHRRLEAQMQQAQKLESLGLMAGGIAHDFNNLLTAILGYASLARMDLPPDSKVVPLLEEVEKAARRAAELTQQMLSYAGRGRIVPQSVSLSALVQEMEPLLRTMSRQADLKLELAASPLTIEADPALLRQVILNLVVNAVEALGNAPGTITLCTGVRHAGRAELFSPYLHADFPEGPYAYLEVADTGCGMSEEVAARVFDPFFSTKFTGRGLGLAAVLGIIRGHQGTIQVASEPGQGSIFRVFLPCSPPPQAPAGRPATE